MKAQRPVDAPSRADAHRLRQARRIARAEVAEAEACYTAERLGAFRRELAATVRAASPVLISLLDLEGLSVEDVVDRIVPTPGWPSRPRLSRVLGGWAKESHALRHALAAIAVGRFPKEAEMMHGAEFPLKSGGWAQVRVIGHSLEIKVKLGEATFETRHGELRVALPGSLPLALIAASANRLLDDVLLSPIIAGRGWRVDDVEHGPATTVIVVVTGNVPCVIV